LLIDEGSPKQLVVNQVDLRQGFEVEHIQNFIPLWEMVTKIDLTIGIKDRINGSKYSASSAYKMQFAGTIFSTIHDMVWKIWDPLNNIQHNNIQHKGHFYTN
jgi:hypothetical protein